MEADFEGKESADHDCETLLEKLRSEMRVCKMQLTKLCSRLLRLTSREGDEQSLKRAEAEMEKVTTDTDREIATVKEFLTSLTVKASSMSDAESQGDPLEVKAPKSNITGGITTKFENFWATFESIVGETDEPAKYKMIRLKSCLEGKAEDAISRLGLSGEAYEEAKNTLKRRFGGGRRQLQNYLEEIKKIRPLQEGNIRNLR
ncbi:hypothetical protein P5673_025359 [Acropora cervicornis]|uniref:Uncharacterized protein n=1 Tax=Acropora cervicornis TaxID=6130 RepID=A0AAD9UXI0_ACRCE|nr:hypothetical protein P5673_025359 [Acropora cervicornis]